MPERVIPNITEYEAVKHVLETKLEALKWERDQLREERSDIKHDPDMGPECDEYKQVEMELKKARIRYWTLKNILDELDDDVCDVLNGVWW